MLKINKILIIKILISYVNKNVIKFIRNDNHMKSSQSSNSPEKSTS